VRGLEKDFCRFIMLGSLPWGIPKVVD